MVLRQFVQSDPLVAGLHARPLEAGAGDSAQMFRQSLCVPSATYPRTPLPIVPKFGWHGACSSVDRHE